MNSNEDSREMATLVRTNFRFLEYARRTTLLFVLLVCAATAAAQGRKYGVFVGINDYPFEGGQLHGAVNDATKLRDTMVSLFGFDLGHTSLLTNSAATRDGIIGSLTKYEGLVRRGDLFVFTYSGHGTVFPDKYSEELDETRKISMNVLLGEERFVLPLGLYDSALVPIDADKDTGGRSWKNLILDDELYGLFSAFTRKGASVVFLSDSCHSGSIGKGARTESVRVKFISPLKALKVKSLEETKATTPRNQKITTRQLGGQYLILTGSKDDEFSLDVGGGTPNASGLFTRTLLKVIEVRGTDMTYSQLIRLVQPEVNRQAREADNPQTPQLDARFGDPDAKIFRAPTGAN